MCRFFKGGGCGSRLGVGVAIGVRLALEMEDKGVQICVRGGVVVAGERRIGVKST